MYAYVFLRVKDAALAEDLCAGAWRKACEKFASYDETKGVFAQWIFTIARNEINMHRRLYWVRHFFSLTDTEDVLPLQDKTPLRQAEEDELKRRLLLALDKLSTKERDVISLKFYSGLNNRQNCGGNGHEREQCGHRSPPRRGKKCGATWRIYEQANLAGAVRKSWILTRTDRRKTAYGRA